MVETWKSVSAPYYTNGNVRVDYEMANPLSERSAKYPVYRYSYRGVVFSPLFPAGAIAGGYPMNYDNSVGHVDIASSWIDKNVREITIKLRKEDVDTGTKTYIDIVTRIIPEKPAPFGDITKVTLDDKLLPESGTLPWLLNDDAHVKVFFKNTGNVASAFHIWVTDETGTTITGCDITTAEIPADGAEYFADLCVFMPDVIKVKTLTAHIDP